MSFEKIAENLNSPLWKWNEERRKSEWKSLWLKMFIYLCTSKSSRDIDRKLLCKYQAIKETLLLQKEEKKCVNIYLYSSRWVKRQGIYFSRFYSVFLKKKCILEINLINFLTFYGSQFWARFHSPVFHPLHWWIKSLFAKAREVVNGTKKKGYFHLARRIFEKFPIFLCYFG